MDLEGYSPAGLEAVKDRAAIDHARAVMMMVYSRRLETAVMAYDPANIDDPTKGHMREIVELAVKYNDALPVHLRIDLSVTLEIKKPWEN